jgi:hypothetical protein
MIYIYDIYIYMIYISYMYDIYVIYIHVLSDFLPSPVYCRHDPALPWHALPWHAPALA